MQTISAFNGGLFADDPDINNLELVDPKWTNAFAGFGNYDFSEEVNVDVLGHLFERSITELEKLRLGGLFSLKSNAEEISPIENGITAAKPPKNQRQDAQERHSGSGSAFIIRRPRSRA